MDYLQRLIQSTRRHLAGMNVSQRMVVGLFVVIVAGSLVWLAQWAGEPEMVPLFDTVLAPDEAAPVINQLERAGIEYRSDGDRILVPRRDLIRVSAMLAEKQLLPSDATLGFADLIKESSSFIPHEESRWRRKIALQNQAASIISKFTGVKRASVLINAVSKRGLGPHHTLPTASVSLEMRSGQQVDMKLAQSAAALVAGAVTNLTPDRVEIIDLTSNQLFTPPDPNDPMAHDELERRRSNEQAEAEKIRNHLRYIQGVLVSVHAEMDTEMRQEVSTKFSGEPAIKSQRTTERIENESSRAAGPGVVANTSTSITGGGDGRSSTETDTESEFGDERDRVQVTKQNMVGVPKSYTAAIYIPRAFYKAAFQKQPDATDPPNPNALETYINNQLADVKKHAMTIIQATDEAQVVVSVYDGGYVISEGGEMIASASAAMSGEGDSVMGYFENYGAQAGLGALALISLGMMLMFVRKASEGPPLPDDKPIVPDLEDDEMGILAVESAPVGQAATSGGLLMAHEVDEQTLRTREMVEQLGKMVTEDPESAAQLVERWITREE